MANLHAQRDTRRDVSAGGGAISISIRDAGGNPLEAVHVGDRTMVVGQAGQRYSIVLTNHTSHRFESVVTSLQTSSESLSAARSRIQDTDFAAETAQLTKAQILQQAGMAMMAQANQLPQGVLSLLQQ